MTRLVALFSVCFLLAASPAFAISEFEFTATDCTGENIALSELFENHELVLINFWLAGCGPSCDLLPYVQAFQDTYAGDGLQCLIVYCYYECTAESAEHYFAANEYTMPIIEERTGDICKLFCVNAFPHTVILDCEGRLLLNECGYLSGDEVAMQELIHQQLLNCALSASQVINLRE